MDKLYKILEEVRPEVDFREETSFIEDEVLDSLDIIKIVVAIEDEFSISIDTDDIVPESFENIDNMINLIKKLGGNI